MMTPIGFCRPVTKAMIKNRANITAMGSARLLSLFAMSEWVYASGRLLRPVCRFCIGTLLRGQVFLRFRNGPERNGGFSGRRKEAFRFPPSRRSGLSVRFVPFRRTGGIFLCRTRPSSALFAVSAGSVLRRGFPAPKVAISGILSNFVYLSGGACTMVLFSLRGEERHAKAWFTRRFIIINYIL